MKRSWYLVALVPLVIGAVLATVAFMRLVDAIAAMPRVVVPGQKTLALAAGEYVIYAESRSTVDGVAYVNDRFRVVCSVTVDGAALELSNHGSSVKYSLGGYEGGAIFDFAMPRDGQALVDCNTDEGKAVLAIGASLGFTIVVAVVPLALGVLASVCAFIVVRRRRKRYLALAAARAST